jgi:hypothetical protein
MKTLLLQIATPEIEDYSKYSLRINGAYARKHGYDHRVITEVSKLRHSAWGKVEHALGLMEGYDRLFVLDADAFVNNHDISLDAFSSQVPFKICRNDENGGDLLNTGSIILLNSPITVQLLRIWYESGEGTDKLFGFPWEQAILNSLHNSGVDVPVEDIFVQNVEVFESRAFNSWWLDCTHNYNREQFVQHVMARSIADKAEIMETFWRGMFDEV